MPESPRLTLVVATHNRRDSLLRMLRSLRVELEAVDAEVVVVADGCTDGTAAALRELAGDLPLTVLEQAQAGPGSARNSGVRQARGDLVLFVDDDVVAVPGLLREHLAAHSGGRALAVIGPMLPPSDRRLPAWLRWEAETLEKQYRAMRAGVYAATPRQFYTANASVPRTLLLAAGGFREELNRAEDIELAHRLADLGVEFLFLPEAAVVHIPERSFDAWLGTAYDYGRAAVIFERELGRPYLQAAYEEWSARHPLNRAAARACVGSTMANQGAIRITRLLLSLPGWLLPARMCAAVCAALYNIRYWQGIADASGLGSAVWKTAMARA